MPTADSVDSPKSDRPARIPGSVIIMTRLIDRVPLALLHECRLLARTGGTDAARIFG